MKKIVLLLLMSLIMTGCVGTSSKEKVPKEPKITTMSWVEKLDFYGEFFTILNESVNENKSASYYEGVSATASSTIQTRGGIYEQIEGDALYNLGMYVTDGDLNSTKKIIKNLEYSAFQLTKLIKKNNYDKDKLASHLSYIESQLNVSGSDGLTFFTLLKKPKQETKNYNSQEISDLINKMLKNSNNLKSFVDSNLE